jgi:hypothetical protein
VESSITLLPTYPSGAPLPALPRKNLMVGSNSSGSSSGYASNRTAASAIPSNNGSTSRKGGKGKNEDAEIKRD